MKSRFINIQFQEIFSYQGIFLNFWIFPDFFSVILNFSFLFCIQLHYLLYKKFFLHILIFTCKTTGFTISLVEPFQNFGGKLATIFTISLIKPSHHFTQSLVGKPATVFTISLINHADKQNNFFCLF